MSEEKKGMKKQRGIEKNFHIFPTIFSFIYLKNPFNEVILCKKGPEF